ncbi:SCO2322 family protein [Nonomuraea sp. NPDC048916]|uniref:SCO2322 family protein n=1 Tax=Nonomuraea sp. NPDC048916 TaxID=3154232 RepID=UPI0033FED759
MLRAFRVAAGAALVAAAFLLSPLPASASAPIMPSGPVPGGPDPNAPRLWSVWRSDGTAWLAVSARDVPSDGSVVGWRFSASPDGTATEPPGGDLPGFEAVCGKDAAVSGHKRVVVTVDFGDGDTDAYPGDQPPAQGLLKCVAAAENASTAQLLASVARVRADAEGAVVAVDDYPARQKGGAEQDVAVSSSGPAGGPPLALILGGAGVLVLLAGGAVVATRRRSRSPAHSSR